MSKINNEDKAPEDPLTPSAVVSNDSSDKKKKIKRLLIIIAPIIIAIIGAIYFFFFVIKATKTPEHHNEKTVTQDLSPLEQNTYLDIDPITVGLISTSAKQEFLRLDIVLRLGSEAESKTVMNKVPIIKDSLIVFLRSLRATDFNSSDSSLYLKEEIAKRINKITAPVTVKEVLFQEITVN